MGACRLMLSMGGSPVHGGPQCPMMVALERSLPVVVNLLLEASKGQAQDNALRLLVEVVAHEPERGQSGEARWRTALISLGHACRSPLLVSSMDRIRLVDAVGGPLEEHLIIAHMSIYGNNH